MSKDKEFFPGKENNVNFYELSKFSDEQLDIVHKQSTSIQISRLKEKLSSIEIEQQSQAEELKGLKKDVQNRITLEHHQQQALLNAKNKRVHYLWENDEVDKSVHDTLRKLHGKIMKDLKDHYGVSSYRDIKQKHFDEAKLWLSTWRPKIV